MTLLHRTEWSNSWQESMLTAAHQVLAALAACDDTCERLIQRTRLGFSGTKPAPARLLAFVRLLPEIHGLDLSFVFSPSAKATPVTAQRLMALLREYEVQEKRLSRSYPRESIRRIEIERVRVEWTNASKKFWFLAALAKKKVASSLANVAGVADIPDVEADLPLLEAMKGLVARIDALDTDLRGFPGWAGLGTDTTRMTLAIKLADGLRSGLIHLADTPEQLVRLRHVAQRLIVDGNDLLAPDGPIIEAVTDLARTHAALVQVTEHFAQAAGSQIDLDKQASELQANAQAIVNNASTLNAWCSWRRVRTEAVACGLAPLVEGVEHGALRGSVADVFEVAYA